MDASTLPAGLSVPSDDGAVDHLRGAVTTSIAMHPRTEPA